MKYIVGFSRVFVGILFIISGLIKLNDPVGFSFKLEEYFSQGVFDWPIFMPYALGIAIFVVIVEVVLGVMLLIGFKPRFTVWSLLAMILFFTFLTFYSAYFNKVTDCGCFGDAIKLTPWESFTKDIILLVLIAILVFGVTYVKPLFNRKVNLNVMAFAFVGCILFCYQVLSHLPSLDFRPYKIGANIKEGMTVPDNAPKAIYEYEWKFKVDGAEQIIVTNGDYPDIAGEFIGVETTEIQKGYEPPVHDFTIEKEGGDFTESMLQEPKLVMVVAYDLAKSNYGVFESLKSTTDEAIRKGYKVIGMSASSNEVGQALAKEYDLNFDFYFTDETTLKTIVRSNPAILVLDNGTILQKVHYNDFDTLEFEEPENGIYFDLRLKKGLDSILELDQKYRANPSSETWKLQMAIDSSNIDYVAKVIAEHGYPGKSMVGEGANVAAWYVIQHSDEIGQYLPVIKKAADQGELPFRLYAMMLDRHLMQSNKPQIYGTQGSSYFMGTPNQISFIWPIQNPDSVNILRKGIFENTVEENAKRLFGDDFELKYHTLEEINKLIPEINN